MNTQRTSFLALLAGLSIGASGLAVAQDRHDDRRDDHRNDQRDRRGEQMHRDPRGPGAGPDHNFYRGGRLSNQYRDRTYVVDDWHGHHLRQPPRGYHWVQVGGDYVLAAVATGIIADILLNQ